jgi:SAM-dependent methyltransferase
MKYYPDVFNRATPAEARAIILTPEVGLTPDERWQVETDWLAERMSFDDDALVIDYGCGIGRLSKLFSNPVLGVDISPTMRGMATMQLADRPLFSVVTPLMLQRMVQGGLRAQGAIAAWVLQHAPHPEHEINLLAAALDPGARVWVLNRDNRAIPAMDDDGEFGWVSDGADVFALLEEDFELLSEELVPDTLCVPGASLRCYCRR